MKAHLESQGFKFLGCDPVECNENGEPIKSKIPKGYSKEYVKAMKEYEQELLVIKSREVENQNKQYYVSKCRELISNSEKDSASRAAANLMLNSESPYLKELKEEFKTLKISGFVESKIPENQVSEIIDKVRNQTSTKAIKVEDKAFKNETTPDQIKMVALDSSQTRARGLDTDKENIQVNKPHKSKLKNSKKLAPDLENNDDDNKVNPFESMIAEQQASNRLPFQPIKSLTKHNHEKSSF